MTGMQFALFLPAALLVAASPGANNLLSFTHGIKAGFAPTVASLGGRFLAFAIMIAMVAIGLGAILETSETAFRIVKWLGVGYLAWLGLKIFTSRHLDIRAGGPANTALALARREFMVAATNPKAMLLFTAFLPQFVTAGGSYSSQIVMLGAAYVAIEFVAACGYALAGSLLRHVDLSGPRAVFLNRMTGGMMFGAAALLATTRRA